MSATRVRQAVVALGVAGALALLAAPLLAQSGDYPRQTAGLLLLGAVVVAGGALQAVLAILFPRWTATTRAAVEERRGVCLLWGFLISLFVFIVLVLGSAVKPLGAIAAILVLIAGLMSVAGYVGLAASLGGRLIPSDLSGEDRTPLQALVGGLTLCFASLVPVLGQVLALALLFASVGAAAVALFRRSDTAALTSSAE